MMGVAIAVRCQCAETVSENEVNNAMMAIPTIMMVVRTLVLFLELQQRSVVMVSSNEMNNVTTEIPTTMMLVPISVRPIV